MADDRHNVSIRVPVYYQEVVDHGDNGRTFRAWSFDRCERVDVGRHADLVERTFRESERYGFIEAPPGSRMADLDGETVMLLPHKKYASRAEEIVEMARDEELEGLTLTYRPA